MGELAWDIFKPKEIVPSIVLGKEIKQYYKIAILLYVFDENKHEYITAFLQLVPGEVTEDTIWGRGALDDKGSLMAIMESLEFILARRQQPKRGFFLSFSHDQEVNGDGAVEIVRILKRRSPIK